MAFQYRPNDNSDGHGSVWTSYSDLFMGLAFVFLLLYVVASLRTGATAIQQKIQIDKMSLRNEDLANQLKAYESIKTQYLDQEASPDEEKLYGDLMEKLDLLEDQAKKEKEDLAAASENLAKKEKALNKYQQLVRNMVNSNVVAKTRIKKRDNIIGNQDTEIREQGFEITDLKSAVEEKRAQILQGEKKIGVLSDSLNRKLRELKASYAQQQMTKKKYDEEVYRLRDQTQQISGLREQNSEIQGQLKGMTQELQTAQASLTETKGQAEALSQALAGKEDEFNRRSGEMKEAFEAQRGKDRAAFEAELGREKLSGAARAAKEAEFRAKAAFQQKRLEDQIGGLRDNLMGTQKQLADARAELDARKKIAQDIKKAFERAGVKGDVDLESGDVTIDFGDHYFETNRADLKPMMESILQKAMPAYARSLFANKAVAEKISGVEIIGFASPTYKGKVVNPESLEDEDRKAAEYNLDLSYKRARSIFQHVFNPSKMNFAFQKQMRTMAKVSGKSFFEENKVSRDLASLDVGSFCKKVDCKKSQKVLIKFSVNRNQRSSP